MATPQAGHGAGGRADQLRDRQVTAADIEAAAAALDAT